MTKKLWTSLVLGLTLSAPALMVGCGEEAPKTDTAAPAAVTPPAATAPASAPAADAAKTPIAAPKAP